MSLSLSLAAALAAAAPQTPPPAEAPPVAAETGAPAPAEPQIPPPAPAISDSPAAPPPGAAGPAPVPSAVPGEIVVTARGKPPPGDPLQAVNVEAFKVLQSVDVALVAPIAKGYDSVVPKPVKSGLHNFLQNLTEPIVFINYLLQLKPGKAAETLARFTINSTLGFGGLIDVAKTKTINLPYRVNGFAYTMGYYGIKPGPFLFLPLLGPTTVRDVIGRVLDLSVLPVGVGSPFNRPVYSLGSGALKAIDERLERDDMLTTIQEDCPDPYAAERTWYLEKRQAVIEGLHGRTVDLNAKLPQCLVDGMKSRAAARIKPVVPPLPVPPPDQAATAPAM
jgi:phospholipid-binding lipoprotein MlaA